MAPAAADADPRVGTTIIQARIRLLESLAREPAGFDVWWYCMAWKAWRLK